LARLGLARSGPHPGRLGRVPRSLAGPAARYGTRPLAFDDHRRVHVACSGEP